MNESMRVEIERYLAGGMSPEEAEGFLQSVGRDPEALVLLGRALGDQAHLYDALRAGPLSETRPSKDTTRIFKTRRLPREHRSPGGSAAGWIVGAIAASAAVLLILISAGTPTKPTPRAPIARVTVEPSVPVPEPVVPRLEVPPAAREVPAPPPPRIDPPVVVRPEPVPAPAPVTAPPAPPEKPAPAVITKVSPPVIARIEQAPTGLSVLDAGAKADARPGMDLVSGQGLESGAAAGAVLRFPDGTRVELAPQTIVRDIADDAAGGKKLLLAQGALISEIVRQPAGRPMIFATPHAAAKVLGTTLRLAVDAGSSRLEVREGKVQLKRLPDGKSVDVAAGNYAVAGKGVELVVRPNPIDEILVLPSQGEIGGAEWRLVRDPAASNSLALEALRTSNRQPFTQTADAARVTFAFRADAGRDYVVWVRGSAMSKVDPIKHDAVILEFPESKVTEREGPSKGLAGGPERALFNGFMHGTGYWWVGGDADGGNDEQPVIVRFNRAGPQVLRLYASETPIRIDSVWISATQKTRPDAAPAPDRK